MKSKSSKSRNLRNCRFIVFLIILLTLSCKNNKNNNNEVSAKVLKTQTKLKIKSLSFQYFNASIPANYELQKFQVKEIANDNICLLDRVYEKAEYTKTDTIQCYHPKENIHEFFSKIPEKYIIKDQKFGEITDQVDDGFIEVKINFENDTSVFWKVNSANDDLPEDIRFVLEKYQAVSLELHSD